MFFQPGKNVLSKVEVKGRWQREIVDRPGAFNPDGYHISPEYLPAYEEALVDYLKGILSFFLHLS